ncbi:MAG: restriction endonuclease [Leptolyngbya sp. BL-A-14]
MGKERTIPEAIIEVMNMLQRPMSVGEVYQFIMENQLYEFKSDKPLQIVRGQLRRHCEGLEIPSAYDKKKYFTMLSNGTYWLKDVPQREVAQQTNTESLTSKLSEDWRLLYEKYCTDFRAGLLKQLKALSPRNFELFSMKLLQAYGFHDLTVTARGPDGGIDGDGKLKVGLADMGVAFQCKRWKNKSISEPEVQRFRGAIQGKFEQGIFFTTSTFTSKAQEVSFQRGAVPIILVDGTLIVNFMIEKKFGVDIEDLPVYSSALDLVISEIDESI